MSDESVIEARLKAFMFDIKNKKTEGNKVIYTIDHKMYAPNGLYDLFCSRDVVSIEDKNGNILLTREDVLLAEYKDDLIIAQISENRYKKLIRGPCYFVLGNKSLWVNFGEKDGDKKTVRGFPPMGLIGETIDEDEGVYIKGALTLISEPPKGKVTATVIEEINGR